MIRILHVVNKMDRGGIETLLMNLYREIDKEVLQFDFLVSQTEKGHYDDEIRKLGGELYYVPSRRKGPLLRNKKMKKKISEINPSVIHVHLSSLTDISALVAAEKVGIPTRIVHSHNTQGPKGFTHEVLHKINKLRIKQVSTHQFACSKDAAKWCYPKENINDVTIFLNAIDLRKFNHNGEIRKKIREKHSLNNKVVIGHVGRFTEQKNHDFIIDIFKEVQISNKDTELLLIGEGLLEKQIRSKVKNLGLEESVKFLGSVSNVNDYMQAMDVFIFPSLYEGLGIVAVEAQAAGVPVLSSDIIPREAKVSDLLFKMSLDEIASDWADKVLILSNKRSFDEQSNTIRKNGYDIRESATQLTNFYIENQV